MKKTTTSSSKPISLQEFVKRRVVAQLKEIKALEEQYDLESVMSGYEDEGVSDGDTVRGRMSWGQIPSPKELQMALEDIGGWSMTLRGSDAKAFQEAMDESGYYRSKNPEREAIADMKEGPGMHRVLEALVEYSMEERPLAETAGSLASSILDVLGFEWI